MLVTEKKAKLQWCPFARVTDNGCATNRHAGTKKGKDGKPRILRSNALCIGSDCMAWREVEQKARVDDYYDETPDAQDGWKATGLAWPYTAYSGGSGMWWWRVKPTKREGKEIEYARTVGHCGLAGKPK